MAIANEHNKKTQQLKRTIHKKKRKSLIGIILCSGDGWGINYFQDYFVVTDNDRCFAKQVRTDLSGSDSE